MITTEMLSSETAIQQLLAEIVKNLDQTTVKELRSDNLYVQKWEITIDRRDK